jgi:hypothetical protein
VACGVLKIYKSTQALTEEQQSSYYCINTICISRRGHKSQATSHNSFIRHQEITIFMNSEAGSDATASMQNDDAVDCMIDRLREFTESLDHELERTLNDIDDECTGPSGLGFTDRDDDDEQNFGADDLNASLSSFELSYSKSPSVHPGNTQRKEPFETPSVLEKILSVASTDSRASKMFLDEFSVSLESPVTAELHGSSENVVISAGMTFFDSPLGLHPVSSPRNLSPGGSGSDNSFNRIMNSLPELTSVHNYILNVFIYVLVL